MKIYIEVPDNWIDAESPLIWASQSIRTEAVQAIRDAVVEQFVSKVKLPNIKVSDEELKKAVIDKMADELIAKQ